MTLAPMRRFSFAGEQQDSDTAMRIVRRLLSVFPTNPESGSGLLSETIQNAAMLDDGECPEAIVFQLK